MFETTNQPTIEIHGDLIINLAILCYITIETSGASHRQNVIHCRTNVISPATKMKFNIEKTDFDDTKIWMSPSNKLIQAFHLYRNWDFMHNKIGVTIANLRYPAKNKILCW